MHTHTQHNAQFNYTIYNNIQEVLEFGHHYYQDTVIHSQKPYN